MTAVPLAVRPARRATRPADLRPHPAWLQALPHYDPDYDYRWERYVYESDFTTDPGYLVANVTMPQGDAQARFIENQHRLRDFVRHQRLFEGQHCRVLWDRLIHQLDRWLAATHGPRPLWDRLPERVSPDIALWVTPTPLPPRDAYKAPDVGLPRLVMECVSRHSRRAAYGRYEEWSTKRTLYAWLGIPEYWIYDPTQKPALFQGHRWVQPGLYRAIPALTDPPGGVLSTVLDTALAVTAEHVLQLWDPGQGTWFDPNAVIRDEGRAQERLDGFLRTLPDTGLPPALQTALADRLERVRPHAHALPPEAIPDAGALWRTLSRHGGPDRVPHAALWALVPPRAGRANPTPTAGAVVSRDGHSGHSAPR